MEALKDIRARPLQLKADNKTRLQIPALVRRMIKAGPGTRFNLYVMEDGDLYFAKEK